MKNESRETLSSRLGFILISAGCAIGLGNVWRFPYVTGQNGGAIFVLFYLLFILILGIPIMVSEFSVGRASQKSVARAFHELEPKGTKWHLFSYFAVAANYILMMFYTVIAGWILYYLFSICKGDLSGLNPSEITQFFENTQTNPVTSLTWMFITIILGFGICLLGLQNGVEKITKVMMSFLFLILIALVIRTANLPNAIEGIKFFIKPNVQTVKEVGLLNVISAAMGQAFFSLSIGIGSMELFGSYLKKDMKLTGEAINITILDTFVAIMSGLIIFPACTSFGIDAGAGPGLIFVTLPNIFNSMAGGRIWGTLFFLFMCFAALSTIIAIFENIVSFGFDLFGWSRRKSVIINIILLTILSVPCALGSNLLSFIQPLGHGSTILDFEDFLVSQNFLPLGAIVFLFFCTTKYGWGFENFIKEANTGKGLSFPKKTKTYLKIILPILILFIFIQGYLSIFS